MSMEEIKKPVSLDCTHRGTAKNTQDLQKS